MRRERINIRGIGSAVAATLAAAFWCGTACGATPAKQVNDRAAEKTQTNPGKAQQGKGSGAQKPGGKEASADEAQSKLERKQEQQFSAYSKRAKKAFDGGNYRQCILCLTDAIAVKEDSTAYYWRGRAHEAMSDQLRAENRLALEDFQNAFRIDPTFREALYHGGIVLMNMGRLAEAAKLYRTIVKLHPDDTGAHVRLADCLNNLKDNSGAIEQYTLHIGLKPHDDGSYFKRARVYERIGKVDKAIEDYTSIIKKLGHDDDDAYRLRAGAYARIGQYEKALSDYSHAIDLNDESSSLLRARAAIYRKLHRDDLAAADMKKAQSSDDKPAIDVLR